MSLRSDALAIQELEGGRFLWFFPEGVILTSGMPAQDVGDDPIEAFTLDWFHPANDPEGNIFEIVGTPHTGLQRAKDELTLLYQSQRLTRTQKFWMVMLDFGGKQGTSDSPTKRHPYFEAAAAELQRLLQTRKDTQSGWVLETIQRQEVQTPIVEYDLRKAS